MLNQYKPGTILALMCVLMGIMCWMIFCVCGNVAKHMNPHGDFIRNYWIYFSIGLVFPAIGCLGGIVNVYKDVANDDRPTSILIVGVIIIFLSLFIDVKLIMDLFGGDNHMDASVEDKN